MDGDACVETVGMDGDACVETVGIYRLELGVVNVHVNSTSSPIKLERSTTGSIDYSSERLVLRPNARPKPTKHKEGTLIGQAAVNQVIREGVHSTVC
jgi:hypothetical protein